MEYLEVDFGDGTGYSRSDESSFAKSTDSLLPRERESGSSRIFIEGLSSGMFRRAQRLPPQPATKVCDAIVPRRYELKV